LPDIIQNKLASEYSDRKDIYRFEKFLSKEFFENKEIKLTYHKKQGRLLIKIGEEKERLLHELGDGIHMIIILTFPFFIYEGGTIVVEEPELYIHPGLQKAYMNFLIKSSELRNFQIFITSHSNHIVDAINQSSQVSIFSISKVTKQKDVIEDEKIPDLAVETLANGNDNLLRLLGVTNSSVYLSNCTIWVEGITDRLYIQKFIEAYLENIGAESKFEVCRKYKEGIHYSFSLTGGDSIIHWDFSDDSEYKIGAKNIIARKFCSRSFVLVDNDFGKNKQRKEELLKILSNRFHALSCPEIENLLASHVIKRTILKYPSVNKQAKESLIPDLNDKQRKSRKIGWLIDNYLLADFNNVKKFSAGKGQGGLRPYDKVDFCQKAIADFSHNDLTPEAILLVEILLDFIWERNRA
jgi:hypothetical protein